MDREGGKLVGVIGEVFLDEGLSVEGLRDSNRFWNAESVEVVVEEFSVDSQIWLLHLFMFIRVSIKPEFIIFVEHGAVRQRTSALLKALALLAFCRDLLLYCLFVQCVFHYVFLNLFAVLFRFLLVQLSCFVVERRGRVGIGEQLRQEDLLWEGSTSKMLTSSYMGVQV